jgi:hypothetical protein
MVLIVSRAGPGDLLKLTTSHVAQDLPNLKKGRAPAMFLPKESTLEGQGTATIYLVRDADKDNEQARPISNKIEVKFVMKPPK